MDFNKTINLPVTAFPMRGNLPAREPAQIEKWENERAYYTLTERNRANRDNGGGTYILHDGPPYANGDIHLGTSLNKILKDIVVKYQSMLGKYSPYVPGWDCHGLPIELKAIKKIGLKNIDDTVALRKACRDFALSCLDSQKAQFKRLGVWADYDLPYTTIAPEFEAKQVEVFGAMAKKGLMYKGLKPVSWCADCRTALAEAEVEYSNDPCDSIYVLFKITDDRGVIAGIDGVALADAYVGIWTTTPWTLPGNLAVSLGPAYEYTFLKPESGEHAGKFILTAKDLVEAVAADCGIEKYSVVGTVKGKDLDLIETAHPFLPRKSVVIVGGHVTLEAGTGCVHTAPGFGVDDYEVCNSYRGVFDIIVPVDERGVLTELAGKFAGLSTYKADAAIIDDLRESGALFGLKHFEHSYPHCWRCHKPIIYRATEQWFCAVGKYSAETVKAVEGVKWIPGWGEDRIKNMVRDRSDWCISRQRRWGVPIPALYCKKCGAAVITDESIAAVSDLFRRESSDAWYAKDPAEFIPASVKCECGCGEFTKENDIFDVWFDSGCSHAAVLDEREDLDCPADLYLEGGDQFRGWFQSSLLTSVAANGYAPYKAVCVHGWIVDGKGEKMSKSKGNTVLPEQVIKQYGADVLRLWVASLDYHSDIRVSEDILKQTAESYRKIRNTARFILGNIEQGFNADTDGLPLADLTEIDRWALARYDSLIDKAVSAYESMDYYLAFHAVNNFCVNDMSGFYLDILKDRLYCEGAAGTLRRSAQTAMSVIIRGFTRLIAPILSFTAEEIWQVLPRVSGEVDGSVFYNRMPVRTGVGVDTAKWDKVIDVRADVLAAIELKRAEKVVGKSLEARVTLYGGDVGGLGFTADELAEIFIVSAVDISDNSADAADGLYRGRVVDVSVAVAEGEKCVRCWKFDDFAAGNEDKLCRRCAGVVADLAS